MCDNSAVGINKAPESSGFSYPVLGTVSFPLHRSLGRF